MFKGGIHMSEHKYTLPFDGTIGEKYVICRIKKVKKAIENGGIIIDENGVAKTCTGRVIDNLTGMMDIIEMISPDFNREAANKALEEEHIKEIQKLAEKYPEQWKKLKEEEFIWK